MFDAQYFSELINKQIKSMESPCTVEIFLHNGTRYSVNRLQDVQSGYVMIQAYSDEEVGPTKKKRSPTAEAINPYNQVAIAYESISHVVLTLEEPQSPRRRFTPGFR